MRNTTAIAPIAAARLAIRICKLTTSNQSAEEMRDTWAALEKMLLRITIHPAGCATSTKECPMSSSSVKGCEKNLITSAPSLREWLSDMES